MKTPSPYGNRLAIALLTKRTEDAELIRTTLAHVYPGISVEANEDERSLVGKETSVFAIDTERAQGPRLDSLLDRLPDVPSILIVEDFTKVRQFGHLLSGRRAIVTRADLEGMGLIQTIHHLLERQQLHEHLKKASHHLKELAIRDDLTGLYNHRQFNDLLKTEVKKSNRYKRPLGLVIVAIKNFTTINETYGHSEGDRILANAACIIREAVREVDIPTRYGDNEFAIILPESDEAAAQVVAKRIQDALAKVKLEGGAQETHLNTSCGIAALSHQIRTKDELLRVALGALIEAKREGENTICTSGDIKAMKSDLKENRQLIEQLGERLERLSSDAQRGYFQSLIKAIGDIPVLKKMILPHSERVAFFAKRLAEHISLGEAQAKAIHRAGFLHDAGMLAIEPGIITKPEKLTVAERRLVQGHPTFAVEIIGHSPFFTAELEAIRHHHERYDGHGYPDGLAGDAIPIGARIIAITEAWDAMTTPQPYRTEPLSLDAALSQLKDGAGKQFDPELVEKFTSLIAGF